MSESSKASSTQDQAASSHRRWYDHDPMLIEVLDILRNFQGEVRAQAEVFLGQIEAQIGAENLERFYQQSKPSQFGNRWYDQDPAISKAVELLRVVPPDAQRQAARKFLEAMKQRGISVDLLQ
ncbi:MAG: hypothetical protein VKJ04_03360 [Vampirovibrionales bacterium]|nr:hypothetical protein [Vampirovibrionales bacterium]